MTAPALRWSTLAPALARHAWWLLLLTALVVLAFATARRIARVEGLSNRPGWSVEAPAHDGSSATGYAEGQRRLIVPGHHNPSFAWIREAQLAAAEGHWRLRHIRYDAAPDGRAIERTSPYRWWLIIVGWFHETFSDLSFGAAIERGALLADPILLGLLLIMGAAYAARFLGTAAAAGFVLGGLGLFPLTASFQPGAPDPHALAWVFALGSLLPLTTALLPADGAGRINVRRHAVLAGIFGGLGMWNDATSQVPVLLAIALGGTAAMLIGGSRRASPFPGRLLPWRAWGRAGALTTLAASVFEFAPAHFTWSLASVHPIHAVAWWGLGELLQALGEWRRAPRVEKAEAATAANNRPGPRAKVLLGLAGCAVLSWPVVGVVHDTGGLLAADFYARELINDPNGVVAGSLRLWLDRPGGNAAKWATLLPVLLCVVVLLQMMRRGVQRQARGTQAFVVLGTLVVVVLAWQQLRWWNLVDVFLLVMLARVFADAAVSGVAERWRTWAAAGVLVLPGWWAGFPPAASDTDASPASPLEVQALVARDFGHWLAKRRTEEPIVLFSTPNFAGAAAYFGGFDSAMSGDSGNETGYLTAVRIASAGTEQEVSVLLRTRGISHVALPLWDPVLDQLVRVGRGLTPNQELPKNAFVVSLREWDTPLWLRPMGYAVPPETGFAGFELRTFAVQAEQEVELGLSRLAALFVERGQLAAAQSVRQSLEAYPRSVSALAAIAQVDLAAQDRARLEQTLETLIPYLSRRAARDLPVDQRINLAAVLLQTQRVDLASDQLIACFAALDAAVLRTLTPATVVRLLALSRSLQQPFPDAALENLALELIPPALRQRLQGGG